jgi:DnaJ-class molecular chaperone
MENQAFNRTTLAVGEVNTQNFWAIDFCEYCYGRGWLYSRVYLSCPDCAGNGEIDFDRDGDQAHTLTDRN